MGVGDWGLGTGEVRYIPWGFMFSVFWGFWGILGVEWIVDSG